MPELNETRGLLAKNAEIRNEMLKRNKVSANIFFEIDGKEEYQDAFSKSNKLDDNASLMYANLVSLNAYLNKDRFLKQKYITPSLVEFYGSNPQIDGNIGYFNIYNAHNGTYHKETGRIVDDYNEGVHFIELSEDSDLTALQEENGAIYYYLQNLEKAKKENNSKDNPSRRFVYDWKTQYSKEEIDDENALEDDTFIPQINEEDYGKINNDKDGTINEIYNLTTWEDEENGNSGRIHRGLLATTNRLFESNRLRNTQNTNTKILKSKNGEYLRNWNKYKQYNDSIKNLAGNYKKDTGNDKSLYNISDIQQDYRQFRAKNDINHLEENSVLRNTGFINIVRRKNDSDTKEEYKKCMFSIENLAWKDVPQSQKYLSSEQRGPNGGRIMWFPPYDISFDESVNVNWNDNTFIGRGEKVYTYTNTERTGTLSFTLLIDHPNILNHVKKDEITDEDILRFFAGEQLLKAKRQESEDEDKQTEINKKQNIDNSIPQGRKQLKFSIYFPINYSGMYLYGDSYMNSERDFQTNTEFYIDRDWWLYLLIGNDTSITHWNEKEDGWDGQAIPTTPLEEWRGYEISRAGLNIGESGSSESGLTIANPVSDNRLLNKWNSVYDTVNENEKLLDKYYGTRVDYDMIASMPKNGFYFDTGSTLYLNGQVVPEGENIDENDSNGIDFSFSEIAAAISSYFEINVSEEQKKYKILSAYVEGQGGSTRRIDEIKNIINSLDIESIEINAKASNAEGGGNVDNSDTIAWRRGVIVKHFLEKFLTTKVTDIDMPVNYSTTQCDDKNLSSEEQKKARCVDVVISFKSAEIAKLSETAKGAVAPDSSITTEEGVSITDNAESKIDKKTEDAISDGEPLKSNTLSVTADYQRYENEAEYFKNIKETDRLTYEKITEKIKYFNPAFHSISPEGFNARLTFLQQCMRQGHTIEVSDKNGFSATAGNLAFGRMPVCVLNLGDFICSRFIINSASINYSDDGIQWDLNKTGTGVQPMFAKVTLQIVLLGGQSLGGPISRLQNAVSFNYYANTGIYDDRADRYNKVLGDSRESDIEGEPWVPYPKS